jgi:hypothetical protein
VLTTVQVVLKRVGRGDDKPHVVTIEQVVLKIDGFEYRLVHQFTTVQVVLKRLCPVAALSARSPPCRWF